MEVVENDDQTSKGSRTNIRYRFTWILCELAPCYQYMREGYLSAALRIGERYVCGQNSRLADSERRVSE
jgi:hypothetical protein